MDFTLPQEHIATLNSIKQLTRNEKLNLYSMEVFYDYDLTKMTPVGVYDEQELVQLNFEQAIPGIHIDYQVPDFSCTAFTFVDNDGTVRMGRNYDFKFDSSAMAVFCHPKDGYASVCHCALDNFKANDPFASEEAKIACLVTPFSVLDGMNEKGLGVAVLTLDSEPTIHHTNKPVLPTTIILRLLLDKAATTKEAIELLSGYDMCSVCGRDYHFYITDTSGDGRVVEFDPDSPTREMVVTSVDATTNFFICHQDKVLPHQTNGHYGHGKERYDAVLEIQKQGTSNAHAWKALQAAAQEPNEEYVTSNTQWSAVYDLTHKTYEFVLHRDWADVQHLILQ